MPEAAKIIAQSAPSATTETVFYTVPAGTRFIGSTLRVANRGATATTFRIALRPAGATITNAMWIAYDIPVAGNDTTGLTDGLTLGPTDVITVYAGNENLSFNLSGVEIT